MPDKKSDYGVLTEQGYVGGQFGFAPVTEETKEEILKEEEKKKDNE